MVVEAAVGEAVGEAEEVRTEEVRTEEARTEEARTEEAKQAPPQLARYSRTRR
jgi:hypothetical protein